jgi:serine/threonine protein kinase
MMDRGREVFRSLAEPMQALVDDIAWDFEDEWKRGADPVLEKWIQSERTAPLSEIGHVALFYWLLQLDVDYRIAMGKPISVADYRNRFPQWIDTIDAYFDSKGAPREKLPYRAARLPRGVQPAHSPFEHPDYEFLGKLGSGTTGDVWLAQHKRLYRFEALKFLHGTPFIGEKGRKRFLQEVAALAKLDHENIVRVFSTSSAGSNWFVALEYLDGENLDELVRRRGPLEAPVACALICQAARGLSHAHKHGLIHRDVKPANLSLTRAGTVKVLDFGLAKWRSQEIIESYVTTDGFCLGTPGFMAPEQIGGSDRVSPATDVYGLGATLYFLLTAMPPVSAKSWQEFVEHMQEKSTSPSLRRHRPDLSDELCDVVDRLLAFEPEQRPCSMEAVRELLKPHAGSANVKSLIATDEPELHDCAIDALRDESALGHDRRWRWQRVPVVAIVGLVLLISLTTTWFLRPRRVRNGHSNAVSAADAAAGNKSTVTVLPKEYIQWTDVTPNWSLATVAPATPIAAADFSPDGEFLVYGTIGGDVRICDPQSLATVSRLDRLPSRVETIRWSPDSTRFAVASLDTVKSWSRTGVHLKAVASASAIDEVAWHPDSRRLAFIDRQGFVTIQDIDGDITQRFRVDERSGSSLFWTADGKRLITCGRDGHVKAWTEAGKQLPYLKSARIRAGTARLACNKDGLLAIAWDAARQCELWDLTTDSLAGQIELPMPAGNAVTFSADGKCLLCLLTDRVQLMELRKTDSGVDVARTIEIPGNGSDNCAAWHPKESRFVLGGNGLRSFDADGSLLAAQKPHDTVLMKCLAFDRVTGRFATGDGSGHVAFWSADTTSVRFAEAHKTEVMALAWSPSGEWLASSGPDGSVTFWDADGQSVKSLRDHTKVVRSLAWSHSGDWLASGSLDHTIRLSHPTIGSGPVLGNQGDVISLSWSADDSLLAAGLSGLGGVRVWSRDSGFQDFRLLHGSLRDHVHDLQFSPTGLQLAAGASYGTAALFDLQRNQEWQLAGLKDAILRLQWDPTGRILAAGGGGHDVAIWNATGQLLSLLPDIPSIRSLAWSPGGEWLATGGLPGELKVVDRGFRKGLILSRNFGAIHHLAWDRGGQRITFCSEEGLVRCFDVASRKIVFTCLVLPGQRVLSFDDKGRIVSGDPKSLEGQFLFRIEHPSGSIEYREPSRHLQESGS